MLTHITIQLPPLNRGIHLITHLVQKEIGILPANGLLHIFLMHTSAGLLINENADPDVRRDLEAYLDKLVPENEPYFKHILEGPDDMPAHIKSMFTGNSLSIPIINGSLGLGTWQGIYLCEFRSHGGSRKLILSVIS
ncbi:MAG: secondary thiamine-phosphate synthase enzyme YjbQ [Bacteroidales bacterium]|jgi:secondary thiamine-phosphate synthase enzyme|nr:secondary thiamine-phosphate synthase enzyme YjbQ [Bacteroidales bacterium]MDD4085839.1 secondary thiamine-phosphate synthase enzyme YjbQ [Bacteroidales bacterium]MDY0085416.1 secondary thiamine-phosphate synthase enzyme YjbQ [Bacteroidales bacterium]